MTDDRDALGWWTISGTGLLAALRRCHSGEEPVLVYAELYFDSDIEDYSNGDSDD